MPFTPGVARPASTILLLRDNAAAKIEVFMMVRHRQIEFASGALVFPGGSVDPGDHAIAGSPALIHIASEPDPLLTFRIAAIRETFEESGILLARHASSREPVKADVAAVIARTQRTRLCDGEASFAEILADHGLALALDVLVPYAHWITPEGLPKRFDTWFFLAGAPTDQIGAHDDRESTDSIWIEPSEAVQGGETGRFKLPFPTTRNLIRLAKQPDTQTALGEARGRQVVTVLPILSQKGETRQLQIPAEADYDGELFEFTGTP